jgi:hypothetical protein
LSVENPGKGRGEGCQQQKEDVKEKKGVNMRTRVST